MMLVPRAAGVLALVLAALAGAAAAEGRRALEAAEAAAFRAVGRLDIAGSGFCTGTLISDRLVVTAAHCLYHSRTGARMPLEAMRFTAGLGSAEASQRRVVRAVQAPGFRHTGRPELATLGADLALLELAQPIAAAPLAVGPTPRRQAPIVIVAYGRDRRQAPSIHESCPLHAILQPIAVLGCTVVIGSSGGPVFAGEGAERRLIGVISASGREASGPALTVAVMLEPMLGTLLEALEVRGAP